MKLKTGPNTVSESTVSDTELSEFFGPRRVPGENSVSSSQPIIRVPKRAHRVFFSQNSPSLPQNSVRLSEFSSPKQYSRCTVFRYRFLMVSKIALNKRETKTRWWLQQRQSYLPIKTSVVN